MPDHTDLPAAELASRLGSGLLSFPVTHFTDDLAVDERSYREHVAHLGDRGAAGLFAAGGTGEFFSLSPAEVDQVVTAAVQAAPPGLPVLGSVGVNAATAVSLAHAAERAGASGLLLMPPYLTETSQDGLAAYVRTVCAATQLGVIVYNRGNAVYADTTVARLAEDCPTLIGFKDGVGSIEQMTRVRARLGDRLLYVGGLPTAELYAWPYQALGVTTYSSAIFNFLPEFALAFYRAVRDRNETQVQTALRDVVIPFTDLRNRRPGYAVSIVKAGLRVVGRPAGPVRPPLTDLDDDELAVLTELVDRAHGHRVAR